MSLNSRITEMETHIGTIYDDLEVGGSDLTNVDKNIINIKPQIKDRMIYYLNHGLQVVWDNWEKVTGEGTSLTLNNTAKAPIKIDLNGNTSQYSTTGKNYLPITLPATTTQNGITLKYDSETGWITISGTATANVSIVWQFPEVQMPSTTYIQYENDFSSTNSQIGYMYNSTGVSALTFSGINRIYDRSSELGGNKINQCYFYVANGTTINGKCRPMITQYSTIQEWEKFTGGSASPNPDYPQEIQVVSGDNSINVYGKNLYNDNFNAYTRPLDYIVCPITLEQGQTYTFKSTLTGTKVAGIIVGIVPSGEKYQDFSTKLIVSVDSSGNPYTRYITPDETWTSPKLVLYVGSSPSTLESTFNNIFENYEVQLEKGSTATTYEPYQCSSYPINLPVENLLQTDTIDFNASTYNLTLGKTINSGTYTLSGANITATSGQFVLYGIDENSTQDTLLANKNWASVGNGYSFTTTKKYVSLKTYTNTAVKGNLQLEVGSTAHSYTPYGTTPIELCKLSTYKDRIFKSSGKNLCNIIGLTPSYYSNGIPSASSNQIVVDSFDSNNIIFHSTSANYNMVISNIIQLKPSTQYTIKFTRTTTSTNNQWFVYNYDESGQTWYTINYRDNNGGTTQTTFTTNSIGQIALAFGHGNTTGNTTISNIMLNEGSSALQYEPYGAYWYVEKQIGKVVLNGSETWGGTTSQGFYHEEDTLIRERNYSTLMYSNYYSVGNNQVATNFLQNYSITGYYNANTYPGQNWIYIHNQDIASASDLKTWLSTHNTTVYYVLANTTYEKITSQTLIDQLEELSKAKSAEEITNIIQENTDLPFNLDVTALEGIS